MRIDLHRTRIAWISTIALASAVAVAAPTTRPVKAAGDAAPRHRSFVAIVNQHWVDWDRNGDGVLSIDEINQAVRDPNLHGSDAAAAAALKLVSQDTKRQTPLPPLTKAYFAEYDRQLQEYRRRAPAAAAAATRPAAAEAATIDSVSTDGTAHPAAGRPAADWELYLAASRQRIARGGHDAWPGRFILDDTRQGPLGDCYFVAAVGDVIAHDPSRVAKWVTPQGDGHFRVKFATGPEVVVGPLTDAELAISSTTAGDGVWLALLEQALGRSRSLEKVGKTDVEGVDEIGGGGSTGASITLLTGHPVGRVRFARTLEERAAAAPHVLPRLRQQLTSALADGRMVMATVHAADSATTKPSNAPPVVAAGTVPKFPPNISVKHAYAVLAYNASTDVVTFWNPHGQTFHPAGAPGLANGYPTEHGRFDVPMAEVGQFISSFTIERAGGPTTAPVAVDAAR